PAPPRTGRRRAPEPEAQDLQPTGPGRAGPDTPAAPAGDRRRAPEPDALTAQPGGRRRAPEVGDAPAGGRRRAPEPALEIQTEPFPARRPADVGERRADPAPEDVATAPFGVVAETRDPTPAPRRRRHARPDSGDDEHTPAVPQPDPGNQPALAFLMGDPMRLFSPAEAPGRHRRPD
ncbi:hypothetical protein HF526_32015, partial [Pseudonocardia sp. K10HN5]|nr:hypothetical protein [Pseudonocardia acidicola]